MRSSRTVSEVLILLASVAIFVRVAAQTCNCPGAGGCSLNCTSAALCCGSGTEEPQCLASGNKCCNWYQGATQCAADETCCGEYGNGIGSAAFCCGAGSTCCPTVSGGSSSCCGPKQQCCSGPNSFCCDAETEVCGPYDSGACLPKFPMTPNPNPSSGELEWAANLAPLSWGDAPGPVPINQTHVACSRHNGTALIRLADGAVTLVLPTANLVEAVFPPVVTAGYVIVCNGGGLFTYDLTTGQPGWSAMVSCQSLAANNDTVLVATQTGRLIGMNSTTGRMKYNVSSGFGFGPIGLKVSEFRTAVAWSSYPGYGLLLLSLDTGKVVMSSTSCEASTPIASSVLLVDSLLVTCDVTAYSLRTGKQLWSFNASALTVVGIAATSRTIAVVGQNAVYQNVLYILSRGDGSLLHDVLLPVGEAAAIASSGETLFVQYGNNVTAYNSLSGEQLWLTSNASLGFSTPLIAYRKYVYVAAAGNTDPFSLVALDASSGSLSGAWGVGGWVLTVLPLGNRVLFVSQDGYLYSLEALG